VNIALRRPVQKVFSKSLGELARSSDLFFTGPFTSESILVHRLVFADNYSTEFEFIDRVQSDKRQWYYVRVQQTNGSLAWSSPIWIKGY